MGSIKEINIKNRTYYSYNYIIDIRTFDKKLDKKSYKDLDIYNIGYVTIKKFGSGYDVNSVNPLYWRINNVNGYIAEVNEDKYLVFDDTYKNKNKKLLEKYDELFNGIIDKIKKINDDWLEYSKYYEGYWFRRLNLVQMIIYN